MKLKLQNIFKKIDLEFLENPHRLPPSIWVMIAIYRYSGKDASFLSAKSPLFIKSSYFKTCKDDFLKFKALTKAEKNEFYSRFETQLEHCKELIINMEDKSSVTQLNQIKHITG